MKPKICDVCRTPLRYDGTHIQRNDTGEHYLCCRVQVWVCARQPLNHPEVELVVSDSWIEPHKEKRT